MEAIVHAYNKPLFVLEANELVGETDEATMMFEVAKAWDCPLLPGRWRCAAFTEQAWFEG